MWAIIITAILAASAAGGGVYFYVSNKKKADTPKISEEEAIRLASEKAVAKIEEAQKEATSIKEGAEEYAKKVRKEIADQENLMVQREEAFNDRSKMLDKKSQELDAQIQKVKRTQEEIEKGRTRLKLELERISQLTRDEAREQLVKEIEEDLKDFKAKKIVQAEKEAESESSEKAKWTLVQAMQSIATDYVAETTTTVLKIEDEKLKGRIIGKDGRNIRAFEKATGVDLIVDEAPDSIGISTFDPLRREIAKLTMQKLITDGRIHPGSIEDEVRKSKNEVAAEIKKNGQILAEEAGWPGIDPELLRLIGKMKYRTSYGQSLMRHTIEVIRIGASIASELGADVDLVKKACLLHDVGKVLTHKIEGAHHHISGQIARKYSLPDKLVNAIESHHLDIQPQSIEAVVVYLADAISGSRPGARKDNYENYIKRVEGLENLAKEIGGDKIDEVYAIHAGREVRIIVRPNTTNDNDIVVLAKDIADNIEKTQTYPGTVQVTVIRETRAVQVAE